MSTSGGEEERKQELGAQEPAWPGPSPALQPPVAGQVLAGRYTVLTPLGEGGMGLVLAAYDSRLDRRVALKLPHPRFARRQTEQLRMLREAQAMARLSHPHVVQVYDAGVLEDGRLFLSMEYVEGQDLYQWQLQQPRSWGAVLEAYRAAGRGLAAAHAAGLIHRDFKPHNVLVGMDGRVRVTDFGVVRAGSTLESSQPPESTPTSSGTWSEQLTQADVVLGTAHYLSPELLDGSPADERSDLFAFCVALYEALFKQPPFAGSSASLEECAQAMLAGPAAPPAHSPVPAWVVRTVLRGLALDPLERPASMQALVAELEMDPATRRRARLRVAALGALGLALAAVATWGWVRAQGPGCSHMERHLAGVWDEGVRQRVGQALRGTGLPAAQHTAWQVETALERYAGRWVRLRTEVCEGSRRQAGSPRGLALLQERCLGRRLSQLGALTEVLARAAPPSLTDRALPATLSLPALEDCLEAEQLALAAPPPEEPAARAQVERLLQQVDRLEALLAMGQHAQGLQLAAELQPQVRQTQHLPLQALTLYQEARLKEAAGDAAGAEALVRELLPLAAQAGDDVLVARAWSLLVWLKGARQGRAPEAVNLALVLETAVDQAGDRRVRAESLQVLGEVYESLGDPSKALEHYERALALRQQVLGPEHPLVAQSLAAASRVRCALGGCGAPAQ